jgi:hypothetical protein
VAAEIGELPAAAVRHLEGVAKFGERVGGIERIGAFRAGSELPRLLVAHLGPALRACSSLIWGRRFALARRSSEVGASRSLVDRRGSARRARIVAHLGGMTFPHRLHVRASSLP